MHITYTTSLLAKYNQWSNLDSKYVEALYIKSKWVLWIFLLSLYEFSEQSGYIDWSLYQRMVNVKWLHCETHLVWCLYSKAYYLRMYMSCYLRNWLIYLVILGCTSFLSWPISCTDGIRCVAGGTKETR